MDFVKKDGLLTVHVDNQRSTAPTACELHQLGLIQNPIVERVLQAFRKKVLGSPYNTQINNVVTILRPFGVFLNLRKVRGDANVVPSDFSSWQLFICDYSIWWLTRADSVASLSTRCTKWERMVRPFFEYLQEEGVLPLGLVIPALKLPKEQVCFSAQKPKLLGEQPAVAVRENQKINKIPIDKTLAGPIFWRADAEYLDEIEHIMRRRDTALGDALEDYWLKLVKDYQTGRRLLRKVSESEWNRRVDSNDWIYGYHRRNGISFVSGAKVITLTSPRNPDGHLYLLKLVQHMLDEACEVNDFSQSKIREHPATPSCCLKGDRQTPVAPLERLTALTEHQVGQLPKAAFIWRFAGILTVLDMAIAMAILIREHANLTPDAISGAKLLNARGKSYLLIADGNNSSAIFSVDKPRAGIRKYLVLNRRSAHVIRHILRTTAPIRALLKRSGHPHWRYLFLGANGQNSNLGHPRSISAIRLWNSDKKSGLGLLCFYPHLAEVGLGKGTLDFAKIRATQGVLAWFNKGSVRAVHQRLGNSYRISIDHYIPEALLAAWNERIVRRFQNTLLVAAAAEEEYLLDIVDMPTLSELHSFLAQLVYEMPVGRSPLADRIQARFGERFSIDGPERSKSSGLVKPINESLHIRLNPTILALLLAYRQWATSKLSPELQQQPDSQTGLAPKHFIELAIMLQAAVESDKVGEELSRSLDLKSIKRHYSQAEPKVSDYVAQLNRNSLMFGGMGYE